MSPDGKRVATASADETMRFWKIFDGDICSYIDNKLHESKLNNSKLKHVNTLR